MKVRQCIRVLGSIVFVLNFTFNSSEYLSSLKTFPGSRGFHNNSNVKKSPSQHKDVEFTEEMVIGVEAGDSNYVFSRLLDVEIDKEGNIYLLDAGNYRIQKFDKSGKYQLSIGKKGKGPGEILDPRKVGIDSQGNLILFDAGNRRITVFSPDGDYVTSFTAEGIPYDGVTDENNNIYVHYRYNGKLINKFNLNGRHLLSFADEIKTDLIALQEHLNSGHLARTPDGRIVLGLIAPYSLYFYDTNGKLINKIVNKVPYDKPPYLLSGGAKFTPFWIADLSSFGSFIFSLVGSSEIPPDIEDKLRDPKYLQQLVEALESYVDVIDLKKGLITHHRLPNLSWGATFDDKGNYYVVYELPFPRMVKYRVRFPKEK